MNKKNVLVTGACGFIGSHLVETLIKRGARVTAFVYYNSFNQYGWLDTLDKEILKECMIVSGDIRDEDSLSRAFSSKPEVVFHLAALIGIPYSYHAPLSYLRTNIEGTLNLLNCARKFATELVVHTSTSETYGTAKYIPMDENHPLQAQSPYAASKIAADKMAESYYRSFNLPVIIARPFNTYGPRQSARAVIPTVITQIIQGKESIKLGNLSPTRDFNFVLDVVNGFISLSQSPKAIGRVVNIGTGKEISIGDLVKKICEISNGNIKIETQNERIRTEQSEVRRLYASNEIIKELTDWEPIYNLDDGLKLTIEWIKNNMFRYKVKEYNV